MTDEYNLGRDRIGIVIPGGIYDVEYDLKQVQEDEFARYRIDGMMDDDEYQDTPELKLGSNIAYQILCDVERLLDLTIQGVVVPDYLLATFISQRPGLEVYRQR